MLVLPNIGISAFPVAGLLDPAAGLANVGSEFLSNIVVVAMLAPPAGVELLCAAVDDEAGSRPNVNGPGATGAGIVVSDDVVDDAADVVLDLYLH